MVMPRDTFQSSIQDRLVEGWKDFLANMEKSLVLLEKGIDEAARMTDACTAEWCEATEEVIDELSNSLFSISEPRWSSDQDSKRLKVLKRRVHELYARYKSTAER